MMMADNNNNNDDDGLDNLCFDEDDDSDRLCFDLDMLWDIIDDNDNSNNLDSSQVLFYVMIMYVFLCVNCV